MANGDGNGNGYNNGFWKDMPWWVKAVAIVGVPSLISIGVVWSDRVQLAEDVTTNGLILREIQQAAQAHDSRVLMKFEELGDSAVETNRILLAGCINEAQKAPNPIEARDRCVGKR